MTASTNEMIELVDAMQKHRDSGGSVFDCPSFSATPEQKKSLQAAINSIFSDTFKDYKPKFDHNSDHDKVKMI